MKSIRAILVVTGFWATLPLSAQNQVLYTGTNVTGALTLSGTVNLRQAASLVTFATALGVPSPEVVPKVQKRLGPPLSAQFLASPAVTAVPPIQSLNVISGPATIAFNGLSHLDQRQANGGNQFSVEPPNPSVAVGNGFILEGVNNAIQVYDLLGNPLLPAVLSSNQLFDLPAAINRISGVDGVFPTDMRVFFDPGISRWFVLQRAQDNDIFGNYLNSSHIYLAVSQTPDPTETYNIYTADTTNAGHPGCPCLSDYPQIGADQYGFYISANEYNTSALSFVDATIVAISKGSLAAGANAPTAFKFTIPLTDGYEFTVQPATTPPGASYFLGNGGLEYFASTVASFTNGAAAAVWAMSNTSSLATGQPNPTLIENVFPTLDYNYPNIATQPPGNRPYGLSLIPPGPLPLIDGGDLRALSLSYAGGRLYMTFSTQVTDENGQSVVGGAYVVFSPNVSNGVLAAPVLSQGYLVVKNNHLLRPTIAVNAQGRGAIAATVTGPDWYPSAAFVPFDISAAPSMIQIASVGTLPEDGFTGYSGGLAPAVARWGDYSSAVVASDGSVWMVTEYIGNSPRTQFANWDTFVMSTGIIPVVVPNVVGMTKAAANSAITGVGLVVGTITTASSNSVPAGSVISENPTAGTLVSPGSTVNLVVSGSQPISVGPSAGSSGRQLFRFVARDGTGASNIQYAQFLFSKSGLSALNACYISYDPVANVFYLLSDDMTQWYGLLGGSANTIGNAQCTIYGATSGSTKVGTYLTTNVDISFRSGFSGLKTIYQFSGDTLGNTSGWQQMGTWNDTGDPNVVELISLTPNSGTVPSETFAAVIQDGNGATTIPFVELVITGQPIGSFNGNGCFIFYAQASNTFFLLNDTATAWFGLVAGTGTQVSNSQCTLNGLGSGGKAVGSTLAVAYNLTFLAGFAGTKQIYMQAVDNAGVIEVWHQMGKWTR